MHRLLPRVALAFFVLLLSCGLPQARAEDNNDEALINGMKTQLRDLQLKILATHDLTERAKYQTEVMKVMEDTMAKLTPKTRALMLVGLKVVQPVQQDGAAYNQMVLEFINSPNAKFNTITSREDIKPRREQIARLAAANDGLITRFANIEADATRLLDEANLGSAEKQDFLSGFEESISKRFGPVMAIRKLDSMLYVQWKDALDLLDEHWGAWSVTPEKKISWTDAAAGTKFNEIMEMIQTLAQRQKAAEQALAART